MRKGINLIPINNDINKLSAFIPSLDSSWRASQRINSKPNMVESLDAIREFQRQGWVTRPPFDADIFNKNVPKFGGRVKTAKKPNKIRKNRKVSKTVKKPQKKTVKRKIQKKKESRKSRR